LARSGEIRRCGPRWPDLPSDSSDPVPSLHACTHRPEPDVDLPGSARSARGNLDDSI